MLERIGIERTLLIESGDPMASSPEERRIGAARPEVGDLGVGGGVSLLIE